MLKRRGVFTVKMIKIQLLLVVTLLGNAVSLQGMHSFARSGFEKASRFRQRERNAFAARLAESFWQRVWPSVMQWWKSLSEPKAHVGRAARWQKQISEEAQEEVKKVSEEKQELLEKEKKIEQEVQEQKAQENKEKEVEQEEVK